MRYATRARWLVAVAVASAVVLGACGDDDEDGVAAGGGAAGTLGKAELIAAADSICERLDTEGTALAGEYFGEEFSRQPSLDDMADFLRQLVPMVDTGIAELRALQGPGDGIALIGKVIAADPFIPTAKDALQLYDDGDRAAFEQAVGELFSGEGVAPPADVLAEAEAYGFGCIAEGDEGDHDEDD